MYSDPSHVTSGLEETASSCAREGSGRTVRNTTSLKEWSGPGMGCPGRGFCGGMSSEREA